MSPNESDIGLIAETAMILHNAKNNRQELTRFTKSLPNLTVADGYSIQRLGLRLDQQKGDVVIGYKMGLTSRAKMKQMGVHAPICGYLTHSMQIQDQGHLNVLSLIHPKTEPEIGMKINVELKGKVTREDIERACESVFPALEIIDSRYKNFEFLLPDVIADNCSGSHFVCGKPIKHSSDLDLGNLGMIMSVNGEPCQFGSSAAIYGHPFDSVVALVEILSEQNRSLPAGSIVLAGAATQAIPLLENQTIQCEVEFLGSATFNT